MMNLKKILPLLAILLFSCFHIAMGQELYRTEVNNSLNIRSSPGTYGRIVGKLHHNEEVSVYEIDANGWAKIQHHGKDGFVKAQYLTKITTPQKTAGTEAPTASFPDSFRKSIGDWIISFPRTYSHTAMYIALFIGSILILLRRFKADFEINLYNDRFFYATSLAFMALCGFEIFYFLNTQKDFSWFCHPSQVGYIMTVVNFFIFGYFTYQQIMLLLSLLNSSSYARGGEDWYALGLFSLGIGGALLLVCEWLFPVASPFIILAIVGCQIVQLSLILYKSIQNGGNVANAVFTMLLYAIGVTATIIILLQFIALLIVALMIWLVICIIGSDTKKHCGNCRSYSNGYCHYRNQEVSSGSCCNKWQS